jgi:hypothetical protein
MMSASDKDLAHKIMIEFGTGGGEPTEIQLTYIKAALGQIVASGKTPAWADWQRAVYQYCPSAGKHKYAGIDNSDLNTLLELARKGQ